MRLLLLVSVAAIVIASVNGITLDDICSEAELAKSPQCPTKWKENDNCLLKRRACLFPQKSGEVTQYPKPKDLLKGVNLTPQQQQLAPDAGIVYERKPLGQWEMYHVRKAFDVYHGGDLKLEKTNKTLFGSLFTGPYTVGKDYALGRNLKDVFEITIPVGYKILPINTHNIRLMLGGGLFEKEADHKQFVREYDHLFFEYSKAAGLDNIEDREFVNDYYDCRKKDGKSATDPADQFDRGVCHRQSDTVKDREILEIICKQISEVDAIAGWTAPNWQEIMLCNKVRNGKRPEPRAIPIV